MPTLEEGSIAPDFSAKDEKGNLISLKDFIGKKQVILYFYPKDDTPGCTIEACNFRDHFRQYKSQNTQILGVSFDDSKSHQNFIDKYQLPYPLLVDADRKIAQAYGVEGDKYPSRDTIVIDQEGKIKKIFRQVDPKNHSTELLSLLETST
ncbi:MAG: peroxiredoxin [Deltaproteobacteria bacterium]|nr:peroxiredoxin [Deltaproteobacteria bacterium]